MPQLNATAIDGISDTHLGTAATAIATVHTRLEVTPPTLRPIMGDGDTLGANHDQELLDYYYFHPDHLGSSSYITNGVGTISQHMEYLPFGETLVDEHINSKNSPFKYNGKEYDEETGNYYYGARYYDPKLSIFISVDPLTEVQPGKTPYHYCSNNPINRTDPTGMLDGDFINEQGKLIGNDGKNDGKVYVIRTTNTKFDSGVASDGIAKRERKGTEKFIQENSGNASAFEGNSIAYDNSVEIEGSAKVRQEMVDIVNQDNGRGGTSKANNREYGGTVSNSGVVTESPPGAVTDLNTAVRATINIIMDGNTKSTFHSHPSGTISTGENTANVINYGPKTFGGYRAAPSTGVGYDVNSARQTGMTNYVFARGEGKVYIYNSKTGVQAVIPQKYFVTPKQ